MANHDPSAQTFQDHYISTVGFELRNSSCSSLHRGEQILLKYGDLPNWQLLLHYGFAIVDNPNDRVDVVFENDNDDDDCQTQVSVPRIGISCNSFVYCLGLDAEKRSYLSMRFGQSTPQMKRELLFAVGADLGLSLEHSVRSLHSTPFPVELLASMRLLAAPAKDLEKLTVHNLSELLEQPLSDQCEMDSFSRLCTAFQAMRDVYPTSTEEDRKQLQDPSTKLTPTERCVTQQLVVEQDQSADRSRTVTFLSTSGSN